MAEVVNMPKLGFDMAEGTLVRWVIAEGEEVAKGAVLAEIETDKATVEVESSFGGTVLRHLVAVGTPVPVGDAIAVIGEAGEEVDIEALTGEAPADESAEAEAPQEEAKEPPVEQEAAPATTTEAEAEDEFPDGVRASPLARKIAEDQGIDLREVKGSGPKGRIVKKDVEAYQPVSQPTTAAEQAPEAAQAEKKTAIPLPTFSPVGPPPPDERISLNRLRAAIGRRMKESKQQVPHFYVTSEYNMEPVMLLRKQINDMLPEGEKLSVNDFIIKAVALTLRQFPNLNASLDGDEIIRHGQVNIGVAVAVEGGLMTVVSRDTDRKSLRQISVEVRSMVARARSGKVRPDDIEGSTFSVSNLGMYDVEHFIAILNPPEAGILAVGSAREVPVVRDGEIVPGMMMKATISVDHRVSDGAEAAQFMQALAVYLHEPLRLLV
jgi:pyruvate dehydrogenase E2 component (dihydrolipoamide acetyltransferase)